MDCEFCGSDISEGALACPRCGAPVSKPPVEQSGPASTEQSASADKPPEAPLAPLEEDFIAMAEEAASENDAGQQASTFATVADSADDGDTATFADQVVPPDAQVMAEKVELDATLTGGYKGPEASSVAGAGAQTADDPFGLNITEAPPPTAAEGVGRHWNMRTVRDVTIIIVTILVAGTLASLGVYYGFLREKEPTRDEPQKTVEKLFEMATIGDYSKIDDVAIHGTKLASDVSQLLTPYEKLGIVTLKEFEAETTSSKEGRAEVKLEKVVIEFPSTEGGTEKIDMLEITEPLQLNKTVQLVLQNDKWLISN